MAPRSRTGCLTCRQRKLKCSEERPACAQCLKANRECIPSSGITFRHQQNPSMNGVDHGEGSLKSFYGYKETFHEGTVWVDVPQHLTFVNTSNPYQDEDASTDTTPGAGSGMGEGRVGTNAEYEGEIDSKLASGLASLAENATRFGENRREHDYEMAQAAYPAYATHGLEALSAVASQNQYNYTPPPAPMDPQEGTTPVQSAPTSSPPNTSATPAQNNLNFILNPANNRTPAHANIDPRLHSEIVAAAAQLPPLPQLHQGSSHVRTPTYSPHFGWPSLQTQGSLRQERAIDDPRLAFLLRDYSERAGLWMDLFDLNLFFATKVPVLAVRCPLLLYSCVALSAKSLARVEGRKPVLNGQITELRRSKMERWPGPTLDAEGWVRKAREYYDLAVSLLRQALAGASTSPASPLPEAASSNIAPNARSRNLPTTDSDELVAATAILCVYEFLDASGPEWSQHLDGAKTLFDIANDRMVPLTLPPSPVSVAQHITQRFAGAPDSERPPSTREGLSQGRKAVFWNFARQDMLSAFINNTSTRLDTSDLLMWRNAGLKLTPDGYVCPSNPSHPNYSRESAMADDTICNCLIWLLMKLVNFIAAGDEMPREFSPMGLGVRQQELLEYWEGLDRQLLIWHEGLPDSFLSTAIRLADGEGEIEEMWFPRPMCASTMQSYHFARIQLLHNKPHLSTGPSYRAPGPYAPLGVSLAARHASYQSILKESRAHAIEIVAIGLGRSDEGTRIHSVQPLWTAGLVLGGADHDSAPDAETDMWRRSVLSQLRGIERDMGWASGYRVRSLLELWSLPADWPGTEHEGPMTADS